MLTSLSAHTPYMYRYRTYLEPATKTAPKLAEIVAPTVHRFSCEPEYE